MAAVAAATYVITSRVSGFLSHNTVNDQTRKYIFNKEMHTGEGRARQASKTGKASKNKRTKEQRAAAAAAAATYFITSEVSGFLSQHSN